jgi:signal transduction histidine kinase
MYNQESDERMKELEIRYETEKKDRENEILKRQQTINELKLEKKTTVQYILIAGTGILLLLSFLIFNMYKSKQKTNRILEEINRKLKISEQNLKESLTTKDKFFSIIAHDLRNPLSSMSLVSQVLEENYASLSSEKIKRYIESINSTASNSLYLVENLLNWARTQTDKIIINFETIDLFDIVIHNMNLLKFAADKKNTVINNRIEPGTFVYADINLLTTVIRNILSNAVKFTHQNGTIDIFARNLNNELEITIKDNGIGMTDEEKAKLFRIDIDTSSIGNSSEKGSGLGLILCKEFVEKNGGFIRVESQKDQGSAFIFTVATADLKKI